ncbi:MAG: molecular chaperone TorD family protein, partial [Phycisphaerales bacterium]|nr:molecular chaperone TorD family protein [Phycisphaerales bacterium]
MAAPALSPSEAAADLSARRIVASALAAAVRDPWTGAREPSSPVDIALLSDAWELLAAPHAGAPPDSIGLGETPPIDGDPAPLARWLGLSADVRERANSLVFGLVVSSDCPPYESEFYPSREAASRAQHMADAAGFYKAFGLDPDARAPERADHASLIIGFVAFLLEKLSLIASASAPLATDAEHEAITRAALSAFIRDH